jgi:hypothetical protein
MLVACRLAGLSALEAHHAGTTTRLNLAQNSTDPAHIALERLISFGGSPDPMGSLGCGPSTNDAASKPSEPMTSPRAALSVCSYLGHWRWTVWGAASGAIKSITRVPAAARVNTNRQ